MRIVRSVAMVSTALILAAIAAVPLSAAQPEPWLCRDKPVFSFDSPMNFRIANRGGRRWRLMLMRLDEGGEHGGFDIVAARAVAPGARDVSGSLTAGQYFAVAMYDRHGLWICPPYAHETEPFSARTVSRICYGDNPSDCRITLTVNPAHTDAGHGNEGAAPAARGAGE